MYINICIYIKILHGISAGKGPFHKKKPDEKRKKEREKKFRSNLYDRHWA